MSNDPTAPHGRAEDGTPLAPYGLKVDGTPRKSNRGAVAGSKGNTSTKAPKVRQSASDAQRKRALVSLAETFIQMPLMAISTAPPVVKKLGQAQADALAIDSYLIGEFAAPLSDGLITWSQARPGALDWLDKVEEKAPALQLVMVGIQFVKALAMNHASPDHAAANQVRNLTMKRAEEMQAEMESMAEEAGVSV